MPDPRVRKSDPHRCPSCRAGYDVSYFDDRIGERALLPMTDRAPCAPPAATA